MITTLIPTSDPIDLIAYYKEHEKYYPNCEPETKKWFVNNIQKDWIILDCGAHIGYLSILFSRLAPEGHIYAFEPTSTRDMLIQNLEYHKVKNVTVESMALGDKIGIHNDAIFRIWGTEPEKMNYEFITIDEYSKRLDRIDCIKIDVDSFDFEVLKGARALLTQRDINIVVEVTSNSLVKRGLTPKDIFELMESYRYRVIDVFDRYNFLFRKR